MLELQPDLGEVHLTRPASAATTRSALEAIKKKFELSAAAAAAVRDASSEKFLHDKGRETTAWPVVSTSVATPDASEPAKPFVVPGGLIDSRGCAKPAKKRKSVAGYAMVQTIPYHLLLTRRRIMRGRVLKLNFLFSEIIPRSSQLSFNFSSNTK
uniref:Uncharacterized protein n=1 Tax=Anopheles atroparvus TaxID=41427 RepID=A0A182JL76_ANOAO